MSNDVQKVKEAVNIVDVVGRYVELQPTGSSFKANCPFHQERTPSFYVWPDRQLWKCFGACGEGGDVIAFLMKAESMDFPEALRSLAAEGGVQLAYLARQRKRDEHEGLYRLMGQAAAYFRQNLRQEYDRNAQKARAYLAQRQISPAMVEAFEIGLSLWDRTGLLHFMKDQGCTTADLLTVNLVLQQENGALRDRFMGLLMLPIRNARGHVIGFGARQVPPESDRMGKYLNTASTPLFNKSEALYGIEKAQEAIRRQRQAVIVEGYFDVITAHQHGHTNTVACMGTAVTPGHIRLLQRWTSKITFALDADAAGQKATIRNLDRSLQALQDVNQDKRHRTGDRDEVQLTIVKVPQGQDPDELIRTDAEAWPRLIQADMPLVDFYSQYLSTEFDFAMPEEKRKAVFRMAQIISEFKQPVIREEYIVHTAARLQVPSSVLRRMVGEAMSQRRTPGDARTGARQAGVRTRVPRKEDRLLGALCALCEKSWRILPQLNQTLEGIRQKPLNRSDFNHVENIVVYEALHGLAKIIAREDGQPESDVNLGFTAALRQRVDVGLHDHLSLLEGIARDFRGNDSREVSRAALEHLLVVRTRLANRDLELLNISEDTSSAEGEERTRGKRKQLYANRRSLDEARARLQRQFISSR